MTSQTHYTALAALAVLLASPLSCALWKEDTDAMMMDDLPALAPASDAAFPDKIQNASVAKKVDQHAEVQGSMIEVEEKTESRAYASSESTKPKDGKRDSQLTEEQLEKIQE